ncbi:MAG TPA: polysaccharide lyase 6 family protein [Chitinophagaceae bacterium]|nr:polysaccharide lyase 6 family protein [Chitinophagaceae bacterium]
MKQASLLFSFILVTVLSFANTIVVKNIDELNAANKQAKPGDVIILENRVWKDVSIVLDCAGTKEKPITFKARTRGKVHITGNSKLKLGGSYIVVDGLRFIDGYAGRDAVIDFKINKNKLANNCRVTNSSIESYNNPKRMDENNWIAFSGKNNRLDHCSFIDKKNMGVLLAVHLDDDRSRENFHSIDHNYFGKRVPLASNGGEIIRVGVSQHCQFNSNTVISDNHFEECDGETEIISIKSGANVVRGNLFTRCQGAVVLRHGDNNTVENNVFLGYGKEGTGGVRIINRGQWVINNFFSECRGVDFRSPMSIMNGVPNSPAHRYVQVTEAVIANNTFYNCTPISFAEGSDKERSMAPDNVYFFNNLFYNNKDSNIYKVYDNISGIRFNENVVSTQVGQQTGNGFYKASLTVQKSDNTPFPVYSTRKEAKVYDSLQQVAAQRLGHALQPAHGFRNLKLFNLVKFNAYAKTGAYWQKDSLLSRSSLGPIRKAVSCATANEVYAQLENKDVAIIVLSGKEYRFDKPLVVSRPLTIGSYDTATKKFITADMLSTFMLGRNGMLTLENLNINGSGVRSKHFISSDTSGWSDHYSLIIGECVFKDFSRENGCNDLFYAYKSMVADNIVIRGNSFINNQANFFAMNEEKDDKGYYNAEHIIIDSNTFTGQQGYVLDIYRGGNDESTLGPKLVLSHNTFKDCTTPGDTPLIQLTGVQKTLSANNSFLNCNKGKMLVFYRDIVRADHLFLNNNITNSGKVEKNQFVKQ